MDEFVKNSRSTELGEKKGQKLFASDLQIKQMVVPFCSKQKM